MLREVKGHPGWLWWEHGQVLVEVGEIRDIHPNPSVFNFHHVTPFRRLTVEETDEVLKKWEQEEGS